MFLLQFHGFFLSLTSVGPAFQEYDKVFLHGHFLAGPFVFKSFGLGGLYEEGIINLNGPTDGESDIRGFSVYNVATIEQARKYAENDPMVKAGRLVVEVLPWWLAKGSGVK